MGRSSTTQYLGPVDWTTIILIVVTVGLRPGEPGTGGTGWRVTCRDGRQVVPKGCRTDDGLSDGNQRTFRRNPKTLKKNKNRTKI